MTTPLTQYTAGRVITYAYRDCGLVQEGSTPNSEQYTRAWMLLQDMINLWVTQGIKLFLTSDLPVPLVQGQNLYTLGPGGSVNMVRPLQVVEAYYMDQNGIQRPLIPLAWDDWIRLSQVNQQGCVNSYFVDKQNALFNVWFWETPDANAALGTAHLIIRNQVTGPVFLTDAVGFPPEWYIALRWGLADELSTGQPARIVSRCETKAAMYRKALEDFDVEDTPTFFVPDSRGQYTGQEFM